MSDSDFDRELEEKVRAELRGSIVPPATPFYVRDRVERLATRALAEPPIGRFSVAPWRGRVSTVAGLAAALAIAAVVGVGLAWRSSSPSNNLAHPLVAPTLPGTPGPTFQAAPGGAASRGVTL